MKLDFKFSIQKSEAGFRHFIKRTLFRIKETIANAEATQGHSLTISPDKYVLAKRLMELYNSFFNMLTTEEVVALKYLKKHEKFEEQPNNYWFRINLIYEKWKMVFFAYKSNRFNEIDKKHLGHLLVEIRKDKRVSRMALCESIGFSYAKVRHYEIGNTLPSLQFLYMFCQIFGCSIDELIKQSERKFM